MEKLVSAPAKLVNVLSPSGSIKSTESVSSEPDAPKEYRKLLMDMSDGKSDYVMWINCLKSYDWYGEGKFEFNMDKFGVPVLKNGNYKLNLSTECIDKYLNDEINNSNHLIYWEGNYCTSTEDDSMIIPVQSQAILMNKAANVLKSFNISRGDTVLVVTPFIIQIPILLMATIRIGAIFSLFNSSLNDKNDLSQAILLSDPKIIITADCYWYGETIINVKNNLNDALDIVKNHRKILPKIIMIKHGAAEKFIPPIHEKYRILGRRPIYNINIPFNLKNEFNWSNLILDADENCKPELMDTEEIIVKNIRKRQGIWVVRSYSTSQMALLSAVLKESFGDEPSGAIWPLLDADNLMFVTSLLAIPHSSSSLLLFEGKLDYPNVERFWSIINKYKVEKLLLNYESFKLLKEKQIHLINSSGETLRVVLTVFTRREDNEIAFKWITTTFPNAKHVAIVY